jgi:hypothetical protein
VDIFSRGVRIPVKKPKSIKELLQVGGKRISSLTSRAEERTVTRDHVCAALPPQLAQIVVSAGLEHGQLTIGVAGGSWATRLRYATDSLRMRVGSSLGTDIHSVRIRVVPPPRT